MIPFKATLPVVPGRVPDVVTELVSVEPDDGSLGAEVHQLGHLVVERGLLLGGGGRGQEEDGGRGRGQHQQRPRGGGHRQGGGEREVEKTLVR